MSRIQVFGRTSSINVRKVLWTLTEMGAEFVHEERWGSTRPKVPSPELLALNPNGLIPVIKDENGVLWESNTICRYVAQKFGRTDLLPAAAFERANVERWMDWQATELNTAWRYAFMHFVRHDPGYDNTQEIENSIRRSNTLMAILDSHLESGGPFVTGTQFTLADIVVGLSAHRWEMMPIDHITVPQVGRWLAALRSRASANAFMSDQYP